ncbi:MAG: chloride channel protein [Acidobacteriota bacterium]
MSGGFRQRLARLRSLASREEAPRLSDESRWYTEHTTLLISTLKWALLGAGAGLCVGWGTRVFLWSLERSADMARALTYGRVPVFAVLPVALPACVWMIRTFAADARGHGTEAVIAAVHQRSGRVNWVVAPVKLAATVVTLAFGGSVGKEGPAAQIGAALTSLFADILRLRDEDRRRLVICGISAGFAAVFGTPVSGALFGIEVLYLGRIDYAVIFPALVAGIVGHLACGGRPPFPTLQGTLADGGQVTTILITLAAGALFGLIALLLIESLRFCERVLRRFEHRPYAVAAAGGAALVVLYAVAGDTYAGLGTETINGVLAGTTPVIAGAFLLKILATSVTLEFGGSGGIITPIFFVGATSGAALAPLFGVSPALLGSVGVVAVLAAGANTPIAAAVMAMEILPASDGVYAALAAATAFLMVGHRSVYASQKLGLSKSAGLDVELGGSIGDVERSDVRIRKGSLTERVHRLGRAPTPVRDNQPDGEDRAQEPDD